MAIPTHIDHFEILRELGRGGMGKVYLARDTNLGRQVAIKVVTFEGATTQRERDEQQAFSARLLKEARIAAGLDHTGIVTIFQASMQADQPYVVMQYIDGKTLEDLLEPDKPLDPAESCRILREAADALDYAHANGIIHRDIKPPNIMLLSRNRAVKICDFGIAKSAMLSGKTSSVLMGTPHYMAPEQLMYQPADRRTDQWALAVVAYRLLTGKMPFEGEDLRSLAAMIVGVPPKAPHQLNPHLPARAKDVLEKALSKDPTARYSTCSDFATDLAEALQRPPLPRPPAPEEIAADVAASNRLWKDVQAVQQYREAAAAGDAVGMYNLGVMYRQGRGGLPKDDVQAVHWYRKAADAGDGSAMYNLGVLYRNGDGGLPKDAVQAVYWYRKAADAGDGTAMYNLGILYGKGDGGLPKDAVQEVHWYRKAAEAGDTSGMTNLGFMYEKGRGGLRRDEAQAAHWYRKAAEAGNAGGMNNLGVMYRDGSGGLPKDGVQAEFWFRKAGAGGNASAMYNLALMYEKGRVLPKDLSQAIELYRKAVELGDDDARQALKRLGK